MALRPPSAWAVTQALVLPGDVSPSRCEMVMLSVSRANFLLLKTALSPGLPLCSTSSCLGAPCQGMKIAPALMASGWFSQTGQLAELALQSASEVKAVFLSPAPPNMNIRFHLTLEEVSLLRVKSSLNAKMSKCCREAWMKRATKTDSQMKQPGG